MAPALYSSILNSLSAIDYAGKVSYSRYNEPLADRIILERIAEARQKLPNALLHTNTNGDYLDRDYIEALYNAGLRSLNIQIYLQNAERYSDVRIRERAERTLSRIDLPWHLRVNRPDEWLEYRIAYRDMIIRLYGRNFGRNGSNRGGLLDLNNDYVRTAPCHLPTTSIYIDYNGKVLPCCNFRSDSPDHADYIIGDLNAGTDIFAIYATPHATSFRNSLKSWREKDGLCRNCSFAAQTRWRNTWVLLNRTLRHCIRG